MAPLVDRPAKAPELTSSRPRRGQRVRAFIRRFFSPMLRELSRTTRIARTLWDATQLQALQREQCRQIGEIAIKLVREGKLKHIGIERILAKIVRTERILRRQELLLKNHQERGDLTEVMREDRQLNEDSLEPI